MTALVRAEILKIRTTRMWWGLLLGAAGLTILTVLLTGLIADTAGSPFSLEDPGTLRSLYAGGFGGSYIFAMIIGIIGMSGEYRHQTITPTLLTAPRRTRLVAAKLVTYALTGLFYGLVTTALAVLVAAAVLLGRGRELGLADNDVPLTLALSVLGVGVWAVFGFGIGTLIKNQIAAILSAVGAIFVVESILTFALNAWDLGAVAQYLPGVASQAIVQPGDQGIDLLPWWGGALVLSAYGLVFAALGAVLTLRRDVT